MMEPRPSESGKRKDEIIKLDFYSKSSNIPQAVKRESYAHDDSEEDKQNDSHDSHTSNKLLV